MATKKGKKFPTILYVFYDPLEDADGTSYLLCTEKPEDSVSVGQKTLLGVYNLEKVVVAYGEARIEEE